MSRRQRCIRVREAAGGSRLPPGGVPYRQPSIALEWLAMKRLFALPVSAAVLALAVAAQVKITPGPETVATMVSVLVLAALFASFVPARRASRLDPIRALRQE